MKIELQIGTIEVDSLPSGMEAEALRPAIAAELERRIREGGIDTFGAHAPPAPNISSPTRSSDGLAESIADTVYRGLNR